MECCNADYYKRHKDAEDENGKEKSVSSFDDVLQSLSCNIKYELVEKNHCFFGAMTRATLNTAATWGSGKLIQLLNGYLPGWAMK
jgi:hypothetical protein